MPKKGFFLDGLPIHKRLKAWLVSLGIILLLINHIVPNVFTSLNYPGRGFVSVGIILLTLLFSFGSKLGEGLVIGFSIFAIISNFWDLSVFDISSWRLQILVGSISVLLIELLIGRISVTNLVATIKRQFGIGKH